MAKGIASKNSLKALAHPIQQFLAGWGARERPAAAEGFGIELPAPYELAALRGEAVLRTRFFGALIAKLPVTLDAEQQIALWRDLVEEGGLITAWVQRLGIAKALRREAVIAHDASQASRKLYALLLDALSAQAPELLPWAVEDYFWHCWKTRFPEAGTVAGKPSDTQADVLRERLVRGLRRRFGEPVDVKESFQQDNRLVHFALYIKRHSQGCWEPWALVERPRLRAARFAGYDAALKKCSEPIGLHA